MTLNAIYMAVNNRIIGSSGHESHYIFDLLMNKSTDITPEIVPTDTHGVNHVNFALLDLFGYQFTTRYAKINTVIETMFNVTTVKNDLMLEGFTEYDRLVRAGHLLIYIDDPERSHVRRH